MNSIDKIKSLVDNLNKNIHVLKKSLKELENETQKSNNAKHENLFLNSSNDSSVSSVHQNIYETILSLKNILTSEHFYQDNNTWTFLIENNFDFAHILIEIWTHLKEIYSMLNFKADMIIADENANKKADQNERNVSILRYIGNMTLILTKNQYLNNELVDFVSCLINKKIINILIEFFNSDKSNEKNEAFISCDLIQIAKILRNLSKNLLEKSIWKSIDVEGRLRKSKIMNDPEFRTIVNGLTLRINQKKPDETLKFFSKLSSKELIESKEAYIDMYLLKKLLKKPIFDQFQIFIDHDCLKLFENLLVKFYEIRTQLDFAAYKEKIDDPDENADLNERQISILDCLFFIINKLAFKSIDLGLYLNNKTLIKILYSFALDKEFLTKTIISIKNTIFSDLNILVLYSDENKKDWNDIISIDQLIVLLDMSINDYIVRQINILIGYLANDEQIQQLKQIEDYSNILLSHLNAIAAKIKSNEAIKKIKCEYLTDSKRIVKDLCSSYHNGMLTGTLNLLLRLSINQSEKKKFYNKGFEAIKTIIYIGNDLERYFSLKLLAQLCFEKEICSELAKDTELLNFLNSLKSQNVPSPLLLEIKFVCNNIIWLIKQNEIILNENRKEKDDESGSINGKHIMISYSWSTQAECIKIRNCLQKLNYKVWIDIDQMHGSTMDTMAKSIESAFCVLICVCEKYRLSENCQLEAKYASKLKKPIIPLILQNGYETCDGWLGFLISDKIFINFRSKRYNFEECIKNLDGELKKIQNPNFSNKNLSISEQNSRKEDTTSSQQIKNFDTNKNINENITSTKNEIDEWNSDKLKNWFTENKIHKYIANSFTDLDGSCLRQLFELSKDNPQFVYQTLIAESKNELKLFDIILFMSRLNNLFKT